VFGEAAHALSQVRPGCVVAIFRCRLGDSGSHGSSIKVLEAAQVQLVGSSVDMGYCAGTTKSGVRCTAVVNKGLRQQYCDMHLAQAKQAIAMRARPECKGTLLVTAIDPPAQRRGGGVKAGSSWQKKLAIGVPAHHRNSTSVPLLRDTLRFLQSPCFVLVVNSGVEQSFFSLCCHGQRPRADNGSELNR
jgi:hypothetical protein